VIPHTPDQPFEHQFLWCAANWLACVWEVMGNEVTGMSKPRKHSLEFSMLGDHDFYHEMKLKCKKELQAITVPSCSGDERSSREDVS
jgi:hypothetical protein